MTTVHLYTHKYFSSCPENQLKEEVLLSSSSPRAEVGIDFGVNSRGKYLERKQNNKYLNELEDVEQTRRLLNFAFWRVQVCFGTQVDI